MDETAERTVAELAALGLVIRSLVIAHALREAARDPTILPSQAMRWLEGATRAQAAAVLATIPEADRPRWRAWWESTFHQCFAVPEEIDLQDAFLRSEPPPGAAH